MQLAHELVGDLQGTNAPLATIILGAEVRLYRPVFGPY